MMVEDEVRDAIYAAIRNEMSRIRPCNCAAPDIGVGVQHEPCCGQATPEDIANAVMSVLRYLGVV